MRHHEKEILPICREKAVKQREGKMRDLKAWETEVPVILSPGWSASFRFHEILQVLFKIHYSLDEVKESNHKTKAKKKKRK